MHHVLTKCAVTRVFARFQSTRRGWPCTHEQASGFSVAEAIPSQTVMVSKFTGRYELGTSQHAAGISQNRGRLCHFRLDRSLQPSGLLGFKSEAAFRRDPPHSADQVPYSSGPYLERSYHIPSVPCS
jgi:hypothetical protein